MIDSLDNEPELTPDERAHLDAEARAYDAQEVFIRNTVGQEAAEKANYGWFVDEVEGTIGTKVYGHGVVVTDINTLEHDADFGEEVL